MIPNLELTPQGVSAPSRGEYQSALWTMLTECFGADLNQSENTPQGQLVVSLTAILQQKDNQFIDFMNQIDPRYSRGVMQDAIAYIYFLNRQGKRNAVAELTLTGAANTNVPAGFEIQDTEGRTWISIGASVIKSTGTSLISVQCTKDLTESAAPNTINIIVEALDGLDRATNLLASTKGLPEESSVDFEERRRESVSANAKGTNAAVYGAVADIPNVLDAFVVDNPTDETITVGVTNYPIIRNCLLVSVVGGNPMEIAKQILIKGGTGCSFAGNTEVIYADNENYDDRPPQYTVKFLRPTHVPVYFKVTVTDKSKLTFQEESAIKKSIQDAFMTGTSKRAIGSTIIASDYSCAIGTLSDTRVVSIQVSRDNSNFVNFVEFGVDEYPIIPESNIEIAGL